MTANQFVPCPDCHTLVLDTIEERRDHRRRDRQNAQVLEGARRAAVNALHTAEAASALARDLHDAIDQLEGKFKAANEAPEVDPIVVNEWPADELDDEVEDDDDETVQTSQYLDDITPPATVPAGHALGTTAYFQANP